ncbi:MAG: HDIG domain-containing protein [Bacteroidetes bacterium]|nr:HDIG domain-containing protein [Bacteroidota bacterium]
MRFFQETEIRYLFSSFRKLISVKLGIFILLVVLTTLAFKQGSRPEISASVGNRWQKETLIAEFEFPIYKSEDSLRVERQRIRATIEPIFYTFPGAWQQTREAADSITLALDRALAAYTDYLSGSMRDTIASGNDPELVRLSESTIEDSLLFVNLRREVPLRLDDSEWSILGWDYARRSPDIQTASRLESDGAPLFERILSGVVSRSQRLQLQGVVDIPVDSIYGSYLVIRDTLEQTFNRKPTATAIDQNDAYQRVQVWLEETVLLEDSLLAPTTITQFIEAVFKPSLIYQINPTELRRREAESQVLPVRGMVAEGEEIVRNGELITPEIKQKLDSLERSQESDLPEVQSRLQLLGQLLLSLTIIGIFALFLRTARPTIFSSNKSVTILAVLYAGTVIVFGAVIRLVPVEFMYAVPVVIVSVLLTVIFDSRLALLSTLILAVIGGFLLNSDFTYTWATLVGGAVAIISARDLRNRGQLFLTAAYAFGGYAMALSTVWLYEGGAWPQLQEHLIYAGVSSFLLVTANPFLWVLERVFDVTTDLRLLELSDTNHPLLRELMKQAPGTCNHSIQVSSLAGSVADEIGANTLLTRVGALYHDVGKLTSPKYFIENQAGGINPHDELSPVESAKIIIDHVSNGLELGQRYRLPARVLHLIASHHGTTRTEYFFQKAIEQNNTGLTDLDEKAFRYPGPRPSSKEAGILMLTDTVEAASRTMQNVTGEKLQELVDRLITHKVASGQLDNTGLTFRDVSKIKKVLLEQLLAIHHVRISYPNVDND